MKKRKMKKVNSKKMLKSITKMLFVTFIIFVVIKRVGEVSNMNLSAFNFLFTTMR